MVVADITFLENSVVYVVLHGNPTVDAFHGEFIEPAVAAMLDRQRAFTLFVDASCVTGMCLKIASHCARFMRERRPEIELFLRGTTLLATSKAVVNVLGVAFKIQPPAAPFEVVNSVDAFHEALQSCVAGFPVL